MSALDDLIDEQRKHEREYEIHASDWMSDPAVAELATLRAELAAAQRTIEAQAKQIEALRDDTVAIVTWAQRTIEAQADQIESLQHDVWLARM